MNQTTVIIIVFSLLVLGVTLLALILGGFLKFGGKSVGSDSTERLRMLSASQRKNEASKGNTNASKLMLDQEFAEQAFEERESSTMFSLSLKKKLYYAKWPISPTQFRLIQCAVIFLFGLCATLIPPKPMIFGMVINASFVGWALTGMFLTRAVDKRSNTFDEDYPVMLLSLVSLLKTGMSPVTALDNVSKGMDGDSLVRQELEILVERLKLGLTEEQALVAFAEDIFHPEVELFIQVLALNMRVGGKLSLAIERLAKQVRKRQEFKRRAVAAVAMERGSIWAILLIMIGLFVTIWFLEPLIIAGLFETGVGQLAFPWCIFLIIMGIAWSRKVTKVVA